MVVKVDNHDDDDNDDDDDDDDDDGNDGADDDDHDDRSKTSELMTFPGWCRKSPSSRAEHLMHRLCLARADTICWRYVQGGPSCGAQVSRTDDSEWSG
jgi:hypothetical protein